MIFVSKDKPTGVTVFSVESLLRQRLLPCQLPHKDLLIMRRVHEPQRDTDWKKNHCLGQSPRGIVKLCVTVPTEQNNEFIPHSFTVRRHETEKVNVLRNYLSVRWERNVRSRQHLSPLPSRVDQFNFWAISVSSCSTML